MKFLARYAIASLIIGACGTGGLDGDAPFVDSTVGSTPPTTIGETLPQGVGGNAEAVDASSTSTTTSTSTVPDEATSPTVTTPVGGGSVVPADILEVLMADAAQRSGMPVGELTIERADAVQWSDASLGCPEPGMSYAQVVTDGFWVVIAAGQASYDYRVLDNGQFRLCDDDGTDGLIVPDPPSKDPIEPPPGDD